MWRFDRKLSLLVLPLLGAATAVSPTEARELAKPAPGEALSVPELSFSVGVPSQEWAWAEHEATNANIVQRAFLCARDAGDFNLALMVYDGRWQPFGEKDLQDFMRGTEKSSREYGLEISDWIHGPVSDGSRDVHRFQYRVTRSDGVVLHGYRYVVVEGRLFVFECLSASEEEPLELRQVVDSLSIANPPAGWAARALMDRETALGVLITMAYLAVVLVSALVGRIVNSTAGSEWNGWKIGTFIVLGLAGVAAVYFWSNAPPNLSDYDRGHLFGAVVAGPTFWPLVLAGFFWWRLRKRKERPPTPFHERAAGGAARPGDPQLRGWGRPRE